MFCFIINYFSFYSRIHKIAKTNKNTLLLRFKYYRKLVVEITLNYCWIKSGNSYCIKWKKIF